MGFDDVEEGVNKTGVHDVKVRGISDRFLHAVSKISESTAGALHRDGDHGSDVGFGDNNVNVLSLQAAKDSLLVLTLGTRVENQPIAATAAFHKQWRVGCNFLWMEPGLYNQANGDVLVERFDVLLALGFADGDKLGQRGIQAQVGWEPNVRHSVSTDEPR
jgi:hypothetical protein